jgi:hypothetical protein
MPWNRSVKRDRPIADGKALKKNPILLFLRSCRVDAFRREKGVRKRAARSFTLPLNTLLSRGLPLRNSN